MIRFLALLACLLTLSAPARAQFPNGFTNQLGTLVPSFCTQGSAFADGCTTLHAANHFGVTQQFANYTAFVSSVQQSSQTWAVGQTTQVIPWNVAGVNYPVGPYIARAAMLNPIDHHPAGCTTATQAGFDYLECNTAAPDVEGYDFHPLSGTDAGQCILLRMQNANSGATVKNNHFQEDTGCVGAGTFNQAVLISNSTSFLDFENNEVDGNCGNPTVQAANPSVDVADNRAGGASTGQLTNQYNWYHNACNRPGDSSDGSEVHQFNVFQNWCLNCNGAGFHGEAWESQTSLGTCGASSCTLVNVAQYTMDFNTVILNAIPANGYTGPFFILGGRVGSSVTNTEVVGNTIVGNNFNATITGASYVSGTGVLTITVPNVSTSIGLPVTISNATGTGSFASANGTFTTATGTGLNTIAVNIGAGLTLTVTGGNAQSISSSYGIMETSTQQFGTIKVAMNYVDTTGALAGKCILQGAGSSAGWTGSISGTHPSEVLTITGSPTPTSPGILVPGAVMVGGNLVPPPTGTYPTLLPFTGTGFGLAGTYPLNCPTTCTGTATPPTYTPQSVVTTWTIPTDAAPHLGGTENWNLLTNTPITGFSDSNQTSTPVC